MLQNEKYIKFADKSTVEVLSLSRLDEAVQKKEKLARTYKAKVNGQEVERMWAWPNLTFDEMIELNKSKAGQFNDTGRIPFCCIVDPYTELEIERLPTISVSKIIESAKAARKELEKQHGKGIPRAALRGLEGAIATSRTLALASDYGSAIEALNLAVAEVQDWPAELRAEADAARAAVIAAAESALRDLERQALEDAAAAKAGLEKLAPKLKGTGLEERAKELLAAS